MKTRFNITTRQKHWLFFSLTAIGAIVIVNLAILLLWKDLNAEERVFGLQIFKRVVIYGTMAMVVVFFISSQFILYILNNYINPIEKLTEETRLISVANAKYRIKPVGAMETYKLTRVINELADSYIELKTDVKKMVTSSRQGFDTEKRKLETLMSQISEGVIICSFDGKILNYNYQAFSFFEEKSNPEINQNKATGILGKGRSVFGVFHRNPIVHALGFIQAGLEQGDPYPVFNYISTRGGKQFFKINIAPVIGVEGDDVLITSFILTCKDITNKIKSISRRDIFLQTITIELKNELNRINIDLKNLSNKVESDLPQIRSEFSSIENSIEKLQVEIKNVVPQMVNRFSKPADTDFILVDEFIAILKEDISLQFKLAVQTQVIHGIWLSIECFSVIRAVMFIIWQLKRNIHIKKILLNIITNQDNKFLQLSWIGDPISIKTVENWKHWPLTSKKGSDKLFGFYGLITSNEMSLKNKEMVSGIHFELNVAKSTDTMFIKDYKKSRPLYSELDNFEQSDQSTIYDDVLLKELIFVVFDTETTGLEPSKGDEILSIAAVRIVEGEIQSEEIFDQLVDPQRNIPLASLKIHEINPEILRGKPTIETILPVFHKFAENAVLVAHNAAFDMKFLKLKEEQTGVRFNNPVLDTLLLSGVCHEHQELHNLEDIAGMCGVEIVGRHTALGDSMVTAEIFLKLIPILEAKGITTLKQALIASSNTRFSNLKF